MSRSSNSETMMILPTHFPSKTAAFAALCAALFWQVLAPAPAAAQFNNDETVYVDLGRWTVYQRGNTRSCVLRSAPQNGVNVAFYKTGTSPAVLSVQTNRAGQVFVGDVVLAFDDRVFPAQRDSQSGFTPASSGDAVVSAFRQSRALYVRRGGVSVAQLSLQTSSAGYRLLDQCARLGRIGMAAPSPSRVFTSAEYPRSEPQPQPQAQTQTQTRPQTRQLPPPPSLARNPQPTNRNRWVRDSDYSRFRPGTWGGGVLQFTLLVDARGRPGECVVNASSGSREFDELTCRNLQRRARFDPAQDANGNAAVGRYSSSIGYQVP